ncbi:MAG: hypothetical protein AAF623_21880, partial [Planctomycetota bacterium]
MNTQFAIHIVDDSQLLSDLDVHQLNNMIWLSLAIHKNEIVWVNFEIFRSRKRETGFQLTGVLRARMKSGFTVEYHTGSSTKDQLFRTTTQSLKNQVKARLKIESSWGFRSYMAIKALGSSLASVS